jgi:lipopolysaccharide transport system permease protein
VPADAVDLSLTDPSPSRSVLTDAGTASAVAEPPSVATDGHVPQVLGPVPVTRIKGGPGGVSREGLEELWRFREVLYAFAVRAVKVKYKQTSIGVAWALLQPIAATAVFAVVFGRVVRLPSEGVKYPVFALAGMVVWIYFSQATLTSVNSLVDDSPLLRKVFFPREVIPLASIGATLVDFAPALVVFICATILFGITPAVTWVVVPLYLVILIMAVMGAGLALSSLNVYYRDIRHITPFLMQVGFYASPIVYSLSMIPEPWRDIYAVVNPVAGVIDGFRASFLRHEWPDPVRLAALFVWVSVGVIIGYVIFKRLERGFADRV